MNQERYREEKRKDEDALLLGGSIVFGGDLWVCHGERGRGEPIPGTGVCQYAF